MASRRAFNDRWTGSWCRTTPRSDAVLQSKGIGEPPLLYGIGAYQALREAERRVAAVRDAVGPDIDIGLDPHARQHGERQMLGGAVDDVPHEQRVATVENAQQGRADGGHARGEGHAPLAALQGRDPLDAQQITQRICGVCPVSHGMASILAQDQAYTQYNLSKGLIQ